MTTKKNPDYPAEVMEMLAPYHGIKGGSKMTTKKNPDYSASAVNLTNPAEVMEMLAQYHLGDSVIDNLKKRIEATIPQELSRQLKEAEEIHAETIKNLRLLIDQHGSYQDMESGEYALKQRRESITYRPAMVRAVLEKKLADMVIVEAVDDKVLGGLVKGGLVTQEQARACGEAKESFAYIIK